MVSTAISKEHVRAIRFSLDEVRIYRYHKGSGRLSTCRSQVLGLMQSGVPLVEREVMIW